MSTRVLVPAILLVLAVALGVAVFVPMATGFNPRLSDERVWLLPDPSAEPWTPGEEHSLWLESRGEGAELRVGDTAYSNVYDNGTPDDSSDDLVVFTRATRHR